MRVVGEQDRALCFGIPASCRNVDHGSAIRILRWRCGSSHAFDEKASCVIAGLDPAIHLVTKVDDTRVILREDALRAFARV